MTSLILADLGTVAAVLPHGVWPCCRCGMAALLIHAICVDMSGGVRKLFFRVRLNKQGRTGKNSAGRVLGRDTYSKL